MNIIRRSRLFWLYKFFQGRRFFNKEQKKENQNTNFLVANKAIALDKKN